MMFLQAGWTGPQYPSTTNPHGGIPSVQNCGDKRCLYNIRKDPEERDDLATNSLTSLKICIRSWQSIKHIEA